MSNIDDTDPEAPQKPRIAIGRKPVQSPAPPEAKTVMDPADAFCPECAKVNDRRLANGSIKVGKYVVLTCKQDHHWSPLGGDAALRALHESRERMRAARLKG